MPDGIVENVERGADPTIKPLMLIGNGSNRGATIGGPFWWRGIVVVIRAPPAAILSHLPN